jgi:hypothetical protein
MSGETETTQSQSAGEPASAPGSSFSAIWLVAGVVEIAAVSAIAAHLPPRARLIGLFSLTVALIGGGLLGWTARATGMSLGRIALIATFVLLFAGQLAVGLESWRIQRAALPREREADPALFNAYRLLQGEPGESEADPALDELKQAMRDHEERQRAARVRAASFAAFLERRVAPLGEWPAPWPAIYWIAEVGLSTLAGTWLATRLARTTS